MTREQVIKGLYEICAYFRDSVNAMRGGTADCTVFNGWAMTVADALDLLKEQEPRVLTLDECATADLVWYDWRTQGVRPAKINRVPSKTGVYRVYVFGDISQWLHADEYGKTWRCWSARPTDEQRKAVKWEWV